MTNKGKFLFHGSIRMDLGIPTPKQQENCRGDRINGLFASSDGIWPMFFALLDREKYTGSLRNGCFILTNQESRSERDYFFSINRQMMGMNIWRAGSVYLLPRDSFSPTSKGVWRFDEWVSNQAVQPLAKIDIMPSDFPFLREVGFQDDRESVFLTWLKYRKRLNQNQNRGGY